MEHMESKMQDHMQAFDDEEIENQLYEAKRLEQSGFMNAEHYKEFKEHAINGSIAFGSPFEKSMGQALFWASFDDQLKLMHTHRNLFLNLSMIYKAYLAKQKAKQESANI